MAQTVSLKLDNAMRTPAAEASKNPSSLDNQAFNTEFDRQIKRESSSAEASVSSPKQAQKTDATISKETDKVAKAEKKEPSDALDGNNLPLDAKAEVDSEKAAAAAEADNVVATELLELPAVDAEYNFNPEETNEVVIEKWLATLQAEMERAGVPLSTAEVALLKKTVAPTLVNVSPSLVLQSDKNVQAATFAPFTPQQIVDKLTPYGELKTDDNKSALPLTIRADILQAITQKVVQTSTDSQQTLKNLMHAMTQNADRQMPSVAVPDIVRQIQTGASGQERPAASPLFTGFTPLSSATAGPSAPMALDVQPGLNQPNWSRVVSSRVVYMAREGVQHAELRLNPAQLGPVEVRLSVVNEQTSVTFLANNAATREALEQALPRLRESFAENGLALNNAEVGQQDQSQNPQQDGAFTTEERRIIQVSTELDDIEDVTPALRSDQQELGSGLSLYA